MGFWIYMLLMSLLIPVIMIGFGSYFAKRAPEEINGFFGYRTTMSMKNQETWKFAHHHFGRTWRAVGWVLLPLSAAAMSFVFGRGTATVGNFCLIITGVQLLALIVSIIPTEIALRKTFDENGWRK